MQFKRTGTLMYLLAAPHALIAKFTSPLKISKGQNGVHTADSYSLLQIKKGLMEVKMESRHPCLYKNGRQSCKSDKKSFFRF